MSDFKVMDSKTIYEGAILKLLNQHIRYPDGLEVNRDVVKHLPAAGTVAITDEGNVVLVEQYREAIGRNLLEIPAGLLKGPETPEELARRELEEETGYKAGTLVRLTSFYTSAGFTDELCHVFLATDLQEGNQTPDDEERIFISEMPLSEAVGMVLSGEITDAKTIIGLLMAARRKGF